MIEIALLPVTDLRPGDVILRVPPNREVKRVVCTQAIIDELSPLGEVEVEVTNDMIDRAIDALLD